MIITAQSSARPPRDLEALAVGVLSGQDDAAAVAGLDWVEPGFLAAVGFEAKAGEVRAVPGATGPTRFLVGLGTAEGLDSDVVRRAAGNLGRSAGRVASLALDLSRAAEAGLAPAAAAQAAAEGVALGAYEYRELKTTGQRNRLERLVLLGGGGKAVRSALDRGVALAGATALARDLVNEPGGALTPPRFAEVVVELGERHGFEVEVWEQDRIRAERLGGLLGVNRGSHQPPRFLQLRLAPARPRGRLALVGKGITFDSGGLSIKPTEAMEAMKGDMAGAAAVVGGFVAAATLGTRATLLGFIPLTDNMTGPDATRVGDVLRIRDGTTVEVLNTDAEGRLILADALCLASEAAPDAIVDLATLTGAAMVALGDRIAAVMANDAGLLAKVQAAAKAAGEQLWHMPLPDAMASKLDSDVADVKNITGSRYGGALAAGLFLKRFVGQGIPWAHLDIAGPAWSTEVDGELPKGGTGFGVRTVAHLAATFTKP